MSQANLDLVESLLAGPEVDIAQMMRDDQIFAGLSGILGGLLAPDFECTFVFPGSRTRYEGVEGLRQAWLDWLAPFERYRNEKAELIDCGDWVLALLDDIGTRNGVRVPERGAAIWTIADGLVRSIVFYANREEAVADAGLERIEASDG